MFRKTLEENIKIKRKLIKLENKINIIINLITNCLQKKGKVLICGNGGSAADAQHLAAEFLIRLRPKVNRAPYPVMSLAMDTSTLTACGNDIGFNKIFARNLEAFGKTNDLLLVISTSGKSKNIINVLKTAKKNKITSIGFLGSGGGEAKKLSNYSLVVPSSITARIQECHIFLGHFIFEQVENNLIN
tara:strand:- start:1551 stop:2114 length:564 start_codon:yes stop_codon:yes gene_type:complete